MEQPKVRKTIALKLKDPGGVRASDAVKITKKPEADDASAEGSKVADSMKWDHPVCLIGRPVKDPLLHICESCSLPILIYGRMKKCRHAFCRGCAKKAGGVCPKCKEGDQTFEEASMGAVHICTHAGGRYDNKGCGRSYLSQRDLDAHTLYRHKDKSVMPQPITQGNPLTFALPPFFRSATASVGVPGLPPQPLPPGLLPPGIVIPGLPPRPPQAIPGLPIVQGTQFLAKPNLPAGVAPPPPPPPAPWPQPNTFKQS